MITTAPLRFNDWSFAIERMICVARVEKVLAKVPGVESAVGQVVLQRGVIEAAHAAPEVKFLAVEAQTHLVLARDQRLTREVQVSWRARPCGTGAETQGRKALGALDAIRGACLLHA